MIESIVITNHLNESLTMELAKPEESGFVVLGVEGLGATKADISLTEMAGVDGSIYNSARALKRNIVFLLRFLEDPTIEDTRQASYKYFPLKRQINIRINADNRQAEIEGYVESNEPDIFSNEEGCWISVLCPRSYLYDVDLSVTAFSSVVPLFEFPFSNESLVSPLLEFSELITDTEKVVYYPGEAPIGFLMNIHASGAASGVVITDSRTLETLTIDSTKLAAIVGSDITTGDDIYISTVKGNKYAILVRASTTYNILNCLGASPTWFQLERGDNIYAYTATSGLANLDFSITAEVAYEGI